MCCGICNVLKYSICCLVFVDSITLPNVANIEVVVSWHNKHILTSVSQHGITCVGFRDVEEQTAFLRHLDRIVQLQHERAVKVRDKNTSNNMILDGAQSVE